MKKTHSINNIGLLVGTGKCNARCSHCAGLPFRPMVQRDDGDDNYYHMESVIRDCYNKGARRLSISGSGEPTLSPLSVTNTLLLIDRMKEEGVEYKNIKLYSNGILIGTDENFCNSYLNFWKHLGLTSVCLTAHSLNSKTNAKIYCVDRYPELKVCIDKIHSVGLSVRTNILFRKDATCSEKECCALIEGLLMLGVDYIVGWQIRERGTDLVDFELSLDDNKLILVDDWILKNNLNNKVRLLYGDDKICGNDSSKLTMFPDGTVCSKWHS